MSFPGHLRTHRKNFIYKNRQILASMHRFLPPFFPIQSNAGTNL